MEELHTGDAVRIYTRGGDDCVGEGCIVDYGNETWGATGIFLTPRRATRGVKRRWVVRVSVVHVPLAITLYPDETDSPQTQPTALMADRIDGHVLWDEDRMRRTPTNAGQGSEPHPETPPAPATEPNLSRTVGASSATPEASSATGMGIGGLVTPSESFFAGEFAGVEALSARFRETGEGASEGARLRDAGEGASEAKLGESVDVEQQPTPRDEAAEAAGSGTQDELELLRVREAAVVGFEKLLTDYREHLILTCSL